MLRKCLLKLGLFVTLMSVLKPIYALELLPIQNNGTVLAKVSADDINVIKINGDRIAHVFSNNNAIISAPQKSLSALNGALYFRVASEFQKIPFTLGLVTEAGQNYTLLITPVSIPSETIVLNPPMAHNGVAKSWEESSPYVKTLVNLMTAIS